MKAQFHLTLLTLFWFLPGFAISPVIWAQDPGLVKMHIPAPEFPPPASGAAAAVGLEGPGGGSMQDVSPAGPASRPAGGAGGSSSGGIPPQGSQSPPGEVPGGGVTWINSPALTIQGLRGEVVMIDFWDYTCINCIRTFPENKKLWDRYRNDGFVLMGVDDAEFSSAAPVERVREAVKRFELPYPVVVDDRFQIWNAYKNSFWPNIFLIDANGFIRYNHPGEGDDHEIEQAIQGLLKEARPDLAFPSSDTIAPDVNPAAPDCGATTPEMYVGDSFGRGTLANAQGYRDHKTIDYAQPNSVEDGHVALAGRWETDKNGMIYRGKHQGHEPGQDHATVKYHAREIYSVMSLARGHAARLYIMQDGKYLTAGNKGADVQIDSQARSYIEVRDPRMYYLVQNPEFGSHVVELFPAADGLMIDSFTFGNNCQINFAHL